MLSITRDVLAPLPRYGQSKVIDGYYFGAAELEELAWAGSLQISELAAVADGDDAIAAVATREADAFVWVGGPDAGGADVPVRVHGGADGGAGTERGGQRGGRWR